MPTYFKDYEVAVLAEYHRMKSSGLLPLNLRQPKPARIKDQCLRVCRDRFFKRDEPIILDFFGSSGDQKECLRIIDLCKIEKFKPLLMFLNNETSKTDEKNIELLAWLIDFQGRPFDESKIYHSSETSTETSITENLPPTKREGMSIIQEIDKSQPNGDHGYLTTNCGIPTTTVQENSASSEINGNSDMPQPEWRYRKVFLVFVLLLAGGGAGLYWWWNNRESSLMSANYNSCMYWAGDHYEPTPCNKKISNVLLVALDTAKVNRFKKISDWRSLTRQSIGAVWYSKIGGDIELFTAEGHHPTELNHNLKPLSPYMYDKYVQPKISAK